MSRIKTQPDTKSGALLLILTAVSAALMLVNSKAAAEGAAQGLSAAMRVIIPSLFCFIIISNIIGSLPAQRYIPGCVLNAFGRVTGMDRNLAAAAALGLIGGYPAAAICAWGLYQKGYITRQVYEQAVCVCVCASPAYLINAVGVGIYNSQTVSAVLVLSQVFALIMTAQVYRIAHGREIKKALGKQSLPKAEEDQNRGFSRILVGSVNSAVKAVSVMSAFVILFCGICAALGEYLPEKVFAAAYPFIEVIYGTAKLHGGAWGFSPQAVLLMTAGAASFGGICVIMQVGAASGISGKLWGKFIVYRVVFGVCAVVFVYAAANFIPGVSDEIKEVLYRAGDCISVSKVKPVFSSDSAVGTILLFILALMLKQG